MHKDILSVLISKEEISKKVEELGKNLREDYEGKNPVVICILKGSVIFYADLVRAMALPLEMDFMSISSYGNSRSSSGIVRIRKDHDLPIEGRHVIIVEDIMDSGQTLSYLKDFLNTRNPASLRLVALLDKPSRRAVEITPDYCGFEIPDHFVVGYGLDFGEKYRNLEYVGVLKPEAYSG